MKSLVLIMTLSIPNYCIYGYPWELRARFASPPPSGHWIMIAPITGVGAPTYYDYAQYGFYPRNPGSGFPDPNVVGKLTEVTADFNENDPENGKIYYGLYAISFFKTPQPHRDKLLELSRQPLLTFAMRTIIRTRPIIRLVMILRLFLTY